MKQRDVRRVLVFAYGNWSRQLHHAARFRAVPTVVIDPRAIPEARGNLPGPPFSRSDSNPPSGPETGPSPVRGKWFVRKSDPAQPHWAMPPHIGGAGRPQLGQKEAPAGIVAVQAMQVRRLPRDFARAS
jgi:hypothetical protein